MKNLSFFKKPRACLCRIIPNNHYDNQMTKGLPYVVNFATL